MKNKIYLLIFLLLFTACYPSIKVKKNIIKNNDGKIISIKEGNYIDNVGRVLNVIYSEKEKKYFISNTGAFESVITKNIYKNYYLLEGLEDEKKYRNLYLINIDGKFINIFQYDIPENKVNKLEKKFHVLISINQNGVFIDGTQKNIYNTILYCIKNNYIKKEFFLIKKFSNL
ncbi:hypothetical protein EV215_0463 [Hypnocyclicus thermotrophus]|uniref:Lipoprotein n=1 Tax=Hypnocyclicus thermotrophus TaxID=1627895 RepID=A0AA46DZG6_9FUSO|nr:hypothetical protein [Hypnocyclicus thermotrophus]TDT71779.1 hypothetical protein EV215_0463 [Hypnocyclicus thermotrophus]